MATDTERDDTLAPLVEEIDSALERCRGEIATLEAARAALMDEEYVSSEQRLGWSPEE